MSPSESSTSAPRTYTRLAAAIIIAAVIISATIFGSSAFQKTITSTSISREGGTQTVTTETTLTVSSKSAGSQPRFYEVTFRQMGSCSPPIFAGPWSVTLGSQTITEPSNATLPVQGTGSSSNPNDTITFSVPNGTYPYTVGPGIYFQPSSGVVNVNGLDVHVILGGPVTSCPLTMTTSS